MECKELGEKSTWQLIIEKGTEMTFRIECLYLCKNFIYVMKGTLIMFPFTNSVCFCQNWNEVRNFQKQLYNAP